MCVFLVYLCVCMCVAYSCVHVCVCVYIFINCFEPFSTGYTRLLVSVYTKSQRPETGPDPERSGPEQAAKSGSQIAPRYLLFSLPVVVVVAAVTVVVVVVVSHILFYCMHVYTHLSLWLHLLGNRLRKRFAS